MPRIRDVYLDCVVYLYPSEIDAEKGIQNGGTGFLFGMVDDETQTAFIYVVTNRHVVENGHHIVRMTTKSGGISIIPTDERMWRFHPKGDDLALYMLVFDPREVQLSVVTLPDLLTRDIVGKFNIGPGDETFLVGRFVNHEGKQQNLPTARFGCIAQMPSEPVKNNSGFFQESFLVETRSIGGYSGSPVFAYIPVASQRENVENWVSETGVLQSHGPWLLGVSWGYITNWTPVCGSTGRPVNPNQPEAMQVDMNSGIMAVVPAWKLKDLLFSPAIVADRFSFKEKLDASRSRLRLNDGS